MTSKERLLNAITGKEVDRVPWSPFLAYYWDYADEQIKQKGQVAFLQELGADPLLRGFHQLYRVDYQNCTITKQQVGQEQVTTYSTPVGVLKEKHVFSPQGNTRYLVEHPVHDAEGIKILQYLYEHMSITPNKHEFEQHYRQLGDQALCLPVIGADMKTAFQSLVEHWMGTEELTYGLCDYPDEIEECLAVMSERDMETVKISADSSAEGFIFWEDSSTTNISPDFFSRYTAPEICQWGNYLHANGKLLIHHACGHLRDLIPLMAKTPIDMIESLSPPPTGNIEPWTASALLPPEIGLIGGIEPTVLLNSTLEELTVYVQNLLDRMCRPGSRFILGNSDSCPPYVAYEKFQRVTEIVRGTHRG